MSKVYLAFGGVKYENPVLLGIFSTPENAIEAVVDEDNLMFDSIYIEDFTLDNAQQSGDYTVFYKTNKELVSLLRNKTNG
jgi:hypothetical protein